MAHHLPTHTTHTGSIATASSLLSLCRSASSTARLLFEQPGLARLLRPSSSTDTPAARAEAEAALVEVRALVAAGSALLAAVESGGGAGVGAADGAEAGAVKRPRAAEDVEQAGALALMAASGSSGARECVLTDPDLL